LACIFGMSRVPPVRSCIAGVLQEQEQNIATVYCTKHLPQSICKSHRKTPQNTRKTVTKYAFCEIIRRKTPQNARNKTLKNQKRHKTLAIQPQYLLLIARRIGIKYILPKYVRSVAKVRVHVQYAIRVHYQGGSRTRWWGSRRKCQGGHVVSFVFFVLFCGVLWVIRICVLCIFFENQCFVVFCGVLWCFAVFCVRLYTVFFAFST